MIKGIRYFLKYNTHRKLFREAGVNENDFFLASFPKSGNTWLRFILARAIYDENEIDQNTLPKYFPTVHRSSAEDIRKLSGSRYIKTHAPFFALYPKCIYLHRDYRAVIVSAWFHAKNITGYTGTLKEFLYSPLLKSFGPWYWHVNTALQWKEKHPEKILVLSYEAMLQEPVESIKRILDFTEIKPIISPEQIAEKSQFQSLASQESELKQKDASRAARTFFRSGNADDWKNHLDEDDLKLILDQETRNTMIRCGYLQK